MTEVRRDPMRMRDYLSAILAIEHEAGGAVGEREAPLTMDRAAVYVALAHLGRWVTLWRWWDEKREEWVETDSADFGDAIADRYDATMAARLSVNEGSAPVARTEAEDR